MRSINILIVEDESPKRQHLVAAVESFDPRFTVTECASVTGALNELYSNGVDFIVLDMSLPTFTIDEDESGGRPQGFGGIEVLRHLLLEESEVPTIVVTGFEAFERGGRSVELELLKGELIEEFGDFLVDVLHFSSALDDWKNRLGAHLKKISGEIIS